MGSTVLVCGTGEHSDCGMFLGPRNPHGAQTCVPNAGTLLAVSWNPLGCVASTSGSIGIVPSSCGQYRDAGI